MVVKFNTFPFPHNEQIPVEMHDDQLDRLQNQSMKRREAYPRFGCTSIREGDLPDILDPKYEQRPVIQSVRGRVVIPLPSMLQKPISVNEYLDLVESKVKKPVKSKPSSTCSSLYNVSTISEHSNYFQHVRQPDFSDFDQMLIQKPVIIYMQKKREPNY